MAEELAPGASGELTWVVGSEHCTRRGKHEIFSTPNLVWLLEDASIEALAPFLGPGQGSVGSQVEVRHLAPTPKGMRVRAIATVTEVDRRRVQFHVEVHDEREKIGEAEHERFIVDLARLEQRLDEKLKG